MPGPMSAPNGERKEGKGRGPAFTGKTDVKRGVIQRKAKLDAIARVAAATKAASA